MPPRAKVESRHAGLAKLVVAADDRVANERAISETPPSPQQRPSMSVMSLRVRVHDRLIRA